MDLIGSITDQRIYFKGATGYNNAVYIMHDICKALYSRGNIEARSVNIEDLESCLTEAGETTKTNYINNLVSKLSEEDNISSIDKTNNTVTYLTKSSYYPNIYEKENGSGINTTTVKTNGINNSDKATLDTSAIQYKQALTSGLTVTQTHYKVSIDSKNFGDYAKALRTDSWYGLASRYVTCESSYALFGLYVAMDGTSGSYRFDSLTNVVDAGYCLRPIVSIDSEAKVEVCSGENSTTNTHKIIQY